MNVIEVAPTLLRPNKFNPNQVSPNAMRRLEESLKRHGWVKPIVARELEDGTLEILGGQHRVEAAINLGLSTVPVINLGEVEENRAMEVGLIDNARYGADDADLLGEILNKIGVDVDVETFLPFSTEELAAIGDRVEVDLDALLDEEAPKPAATKTQRTHQIMRFKVPVDDAEKVSDTITAITKAQGLTTGDQLTNAGDALVWLIYQFNGADE